MKKYKMEIKEKVGGEYITRETHMTDNLDQIKKWWVRYAYTGSDLSAKGFNSMYIVTDNETGRDVNTDLI